ncbi:MAG: HAD-IA family hydrolase [Patescibacteria group bacterium]|nr:HAD-IA family hydrolase [Patescibacteria group bacterium]
MITDWNLIDFNHVEVVSFDLGYTVLGPDTKQIAKLIHDHFNIVVAPATVLDADVRMRREYLHNGHANSAIQTTHFSEVVCGLLNYVYPLFKEAAIRPDVLESFKKACQKHHDDNNFFNQLYHDAQAALELLRKERVRMIVISNAHGTLERDLQKYGLYHYFEHILDSSIEGVHKPNREIFTRAADRCGTKIENILHVGDNPTADVQGALVAGMQAALYDPIGMFPSVPGNAPIYRNHLDLADQLLISRDDAAAIKLN